MNKLAAAIVTLIAVALLAAACGDDAGNDAAPTRTPENLSPQIPTTSDTITPPATRLTDSHDAKPLRVRGLAKCSAGGPAGETAVEFPRAAEAPGAAREMGRLTGPADTEAVGPALNGPPRGYHPKPCGLV